jgi:magnesium transporter
VATFIAVGSVFFLLWTLITGFFGQNFEYLVSNVNTRRDFLIFGVGGLLAPTLILAGLLFWRRRDWL